MDIKISSRNLPPMTETVPTKRNRWPKIKNIFDRNLLSMKGAKVVLNNSTSSGHCID